MPGFIQLPKISPENYWGNVDDYSKYDDVKTKKTNLSIENKNLILGLKGGKIEVKQQKPHKLSQVLIKGKMKKLNDWLLYKLGVARIEVGEEKIEVKVQDLADRLFIHQKVLKKAAGNGRLQEVVEKQIFRLNEIQNIKIEDTVTEEDWAKGIVEEFNIGSKRNHTDTLIKIHLEPNNIKYYVALQNEIAKKIPQEYNRPTIEITINNGTTQPITKTCCILGGFGPLSDAAIVEKAGDFIKDKGSFPDDAQIVLYSSPAPMRGVRQLFNIFKLKPWWGRIQEFMGRSKTRYKDQEVSYLLASNTIHVHLKKDKGTMALGPYKEKIMEMPTIVADGIAEYKNEKGHENTKVLIVGTTEAYNKGLYDTALQGKVPFEKVAEEDQDEIQKIIDLTKMDIATDKDKKRLIELINKAKENNDITHILLGCTELPLALKGKKDPFGEGITLIDTEDVFAYQIASKIVSNDEKNIMLQMLNTTT